MRRCLIPLITWSLAVWDVHVPQPGAGWHRVAGSTMGTATALPCTKPVRACCREQLVKEALQPEVSEPRRDPVLDSALQRTILDLKTSRLSKVSGFKKKLPAQARKGSLALYCAKTTESLNCLYGIPQLKK